MGTLTEGSIEKTNQDVKQANSRFVARYSMENIHKNTLSRLSWEADPVLHYEELAKSEHMYANGQEVKTCKEIYQI